jgi:DNA-binding IclR family transcriptional regulator
MNIRSYRYLVLLLIIWVGAIGAIFIVHATRPTPQRLATYLAKHPLGGVTGTKRQAIIMRTAQQLNGLNVEQRQELKKSGALKAFFSQLTAAERRAFLAATLPEGFRQVIATLNRMEPAQRKRLAQKTLRNVREHGFQMDDLTAGEDVTTMFSQGLAIFNDSAHPDVRRDFAEVVAELERRQKATSAPPATN